MGSGQFFHEVIARELRASPAAIKVLDFGCGAGETVEELVRLGYDAYGCDVGEGWPEAPGEWQLGLPDKEWKSGIRKRLGTISHSPYRLPYPDRMFDAVVSTQVFEHAQNKQEAFSEISRILKIDGFGVHLMPAKWRLIEPHIFVPFASWMWPHIPYWWLRLWAFLGIRNRLQRGMDWRKVATVNRDYCRHGLHYWRLSQFRTLFRATFGDFLNLERARLDAGRGRLAPLARKLRLGWIVSPLVTLFRENCIGHHNKASVVASGHDSPISEIAAT